MTGDYTVRLCAVDAARNIRPSSSSTVSVTGETDPPEVVSFSLNSGDATTQQRDIFLHSEIDDASGVSHYCVTEVYETSESCTPWIAYDAAAEYELSGGEEEKTVRVWFRDPHGNVSDGASDTIVFDWMPPLNGQVSTAVEDDEITVSWSGFTDSTTAIASYVVVRGDDVAPASCSEGEEVARGLLSDVAVTDLEPGRHGFRVCAIDSAGNVNAGKTVRETVLPPVIPPELGRFATASGATAVCERTVDLVLPASSERGVAQMCLDEDGTCSRWTTYDELPSYTLSAGAGDKTVYARVRDSDGTESEETAELDIELIDCAADLVLSSVEVDLGPICGTDSTEFTLTNDGNIDLTVSDISIDNDGDAAWSSADLTGFPWTLEPGETRALTLSATPGSAELVIESDAEDATTVTVPLSASQDQAPQLDATDLPDGEIIAVGEARTFEIGVSDPETTSTDLAVQWSSDVDGTFATGTGTIDDLASHAWDGVGTTSGTHSITATVTDTCGQTDSATFTICQDEGYSADQLDLSTWNFEGAAHWDAGNGWVELTSAARSQVGSAYQTASTVSSGEIDISTQFYVSGGNGADGMTVTALDADRMTSFLGSSGGGIGYAGLPGWTVEVDTYYNRGTDPTSRDHVSVHIDGDVRSPETWAQLPEMEDGQWHELRVQATGTWFTVTVDGTIYIDEEIADLETFDSYVGFSAATGGKTNEHLTDSLVVTGSTCE